MPGPVSDGYDPEFGTSDNAQEVADGIQEVRDLLTRHLGEELLPILDVVRKRDTPLAEIRQPQLFLKLDERQLRIVRFCIDRALESM